MPSINNLRGVLLEEIVLLLLSRSGYRLISPGAEGTRIGSAGLEVRGRGSWHQIDAFVAPLYAHPFIHPIRLLVEAKCYEDRPVDIRVLRSVVGTIVDINQNYFSQRVGSSEVQVQRFNYHAAVFSSSSYTEIAQQYAAAHQVFLIDYRNVALMKPVIDALMDFKAGDFEENHLAAIRQWFRRYFQNGNVEGIENFLRPDGIEKTRERLSPALQAIHGSYYGMIQGIYPVHLVARRTIKLRVLLPDFVIRCRIRVDEEDETWAFEPSQVQKDSPDFFQLEFQIPPFIAEILAARARENRLDRPEWSNLANVKREYLQFVDVTGLVERAFVNFRLALDEEWLNNYVVRRRRQEKL